MPANSFNLREKISAERSAEFQNAASIAPRSVTESNDVSAANVASMPLGISIPSALRPQRAPNKNGSAESRTSRAQASAAKHAEYQKFRAICDEIVAQVNQLEAYVTGEALDSDAAPHIVEIEDALERLYACHWGEGESLKMVVVALQSQLNNVQWDRRHVELLKNRVRRLRTAYLIDARFVDDCYQEIEELGLNQFRGTLSEGEVRKRYRIVEDTRPS